MRMNDDVERARELAWSVLVHEAGDDQTSSGLVAATERALTRLYDRLSSLIGPDGFNALVRRALHLAMLEWSFLESVTVSAEPSAFRLQGLGACVEGRESAEVQAGLAAVLGCFFWLLVTLVGENLFNRLMRGVWPDVEFGSEEKHV